MSYIGMISLRVCAFSNEEMRIDLELLDYPRNNILDPSYKAERVICIEFEK